MARSPKVIIIGAGFGGLGTAIELVRHGFADVTVLEKAEGLGGTWHHNTYPGAACDVPSHLYSYSFAKRRDWKRLCSPQPEILDYLHGVAAEHGVDHLIKHGVEITDCTWDEETRRWSVTSSDGRAWEADAVVLATGQLHQPAYPNLPGRERFSGHSFHSAEWDHEYRLDGKRVAVVGTGASAVQFVPEIAPKVAQLSVFQRSGNWFMPRRNRPYPAAARMAIARVPGLQSWRRGFWYGYGEFLTFMIRHPVTVGRLGRLVSTTFMRRQLSDSKVRGRAWPDYAFGCKRVLFSSLFLPTLQRPNVELINERIVAVDESALITADGTRHEVDCIIYGTGFKTNDFMFPMEVTGAEGTTLKERWKLGASAHNTVCVPSFPSLFIVYGPNSNTSGGSIIVFEEAQARYIRQALELVQASGAAAIDVRPEVAERNDRATQVRFAGTAWTQCDSWYRDQSGRIVANWPGYMREYERALAKLDPAEFTLVPAPEPEPADATPAAA